jgi:heptosyltransferase-1
MDESPKKLLVIRLSSIGDIVHVLPAVAALGKTTPSAEISWAVESRYACLIEGNPYVRHILRLDTLGWRRSFGSPGTLGEMKRAFAALRNPGFDAAIDFQGLIKSGVIARLSGARERLGFGGDWLREPAAAIFYTDRVSPQGPQHVIEANLEMARRLGAQRAEWEFPLPHSPEDEDYAEAQIARMGGGPFILISPGGGWRSKRWPPASYAELIREIGVESASQIALTGSPAEEALMREILDAAQSPRARYVPTNITQYVALARRAALFIGSDTGPMHLAAAVGTPIVALHGPTDPVRNGPYSKLDIALVGRAENPPGRRQPGYLEGIAVGQVMRAVRRRLSSGNE